MVDVSDFLKLSKDFPMADVRSPKEFEAGHIDGAHNIPLLDDKEREAVGTLYKKSGKQKAIYLAFQLIGPRLHRIVAQAEKWAKGKELLVYCWRGGMRSANFCRFVEMAGVRTHRLEGGYKAWRQQGLSYFSQPWKLVRLGGCTGSGKSEILRELGKQGEQILDLEAFANHKGSAFGALMMPPQPTTEQFHNRLFEKLRSFDFSRRLWAEDESMSIGSVCLPPDFWNQMKAAPIIEIKLEKKLRIQRLVNEYGSSDTDLFMEAMKRIIKRLGGQHYNAAKAHWLGGDKHACIDVLLAYYDKYYLESLNNKRDKVAEQAEWNGEDAASAANEIRLKEICQKL